MEGDAPEADPGVRRGKDDGFDKVSGSELAGLALEEARGSGELIEKRWIVEEINGIATWQRRVSEHVKSRRATRQVKGKGLGILC